MDIKSISSFKYLQRRILASIILVQVVLAVAQGTPAQQFASADWFMRPLAPGVEWRYYKFDNLFGSRQSISYIEADLDVQGVEVRFPYLNSRQRTTAMIPNQFPNAAAGINGTFFSTTGHRTFLRINGTNLLPGVPWEGKWGYNAGFVYNRNTKAHGVLPIPNDGSTGQPYTDWATLPGTWTDAMVNGPFLVRNGNITSWAMPGGSHCNRHPRTCVGYKSGNRIVLMVADGRTPEATGLTCQEMAEVMLALGCTHANSLDGGGSSVMYGRGEPSNGVISYPSDNGQYDRGGERTVTNAIAILGNARVPLPFDARLESVNYPATISPGGRKWVNVTYRNIGSQAWTSNRVTITTARPANHNSRFHAAGVWESASTAWRLPSTTVVQPNSQITLQFAVDGPSTVLPYETISDYFRLTLDGAQRFGPADSELRVVMRNEPAPGTFMVESRSGGQNYAWYSDQGMANTSTDSQAGGETAGIGMRYGSTYRTVAGAKSAKWYPQFATRGRYKVYVAWGTGTLRQNPITYHVNHAGGRTTFNINQASTANQWVRLGNLEYDFNAGGNDQGVEMTNESIDVSGNMYAGPVLFEYVGPPSAVTDWTLY